MLNKFLSSAKTPKLINLVFLTSIVLLFLHLMFKVNFIVNMDWIFPFTNQQLGFKFDEIFNYYSYKENPIGSSSAHLNDLPFRFLSKILYFLSFDGAMFQRVYIGLILIITSVSSYVFLLNFKEKKQDINTNIYLAIIFYIFSAVFFNYFTAGWIYVLLYLSLQFLFCNSLYKIYKFKSKIDLIFIFWISYISFSQSQSIIWFGLLNFYIFTYFFFSQNKLHALNNFIVINSVIIVSVLITNFSWIFQNSETVELATKNISSYDWQRFNNNFSIKDLFIHQNFIFNNFYENVFINELFNLVYLLNIVPIILIIYEIIKKKKISFLIYFGLLSYLTLLFIFSFQDIIKVLPFSTIIRDLSRFVVISHLGLTILFFSCLEIYKKNKIIRLLLFIILITNFTPYLFNKNNSSVIVNSSIRDMPFLKKDENFIKKINNDKIIIIPSGGHLKLHNTKDFHDDHHEVYDPYAFFSNYTVNFYVTNKSSHILRNLFNEYLKFYKADDFNNFLTFNKVLGIKNILTREYSSSSVTKEFNTLDDKKFRNFCIDLKYEDQEFKFKCDINGYYPSIFLADKIYCGNFDLDFHKDENYVININCDKNNYNKKYFNSKIIDIKKKSGTYTISIDNNGEGFFLNLNQKFGNNFLVKKNETDIDIKHFKSNLYFNAWLIKSDKKKLKINLIDTAEIKYNFMIKLQISVIFILILISIYICLKKFKIRD